MRAKSQTYPDLQPLYDAARSYLEIPQRIDLLNARVEVLQDMLQLLKETVTSRHAERLEQIVIALIAVEIGACGGPRLSVLALSITHAFCTASCSARHHHDPRRSLLVENDRPRGYLVDYEPSHQYKDAVGETRVSRSYRILYITSHDILLGRTRYTDITDLPSWHARYRRITNMTAIE